MNRRWGASVLVLLLVLGSSCGKQLLPTQPPSDVAARDPVQALRVSRTSDAAQIIGSTRSGAQFALYRPDRWNGALVLYVERGAQMTFVLQSCLLLVSGVYYSISVLPGWMQVISHLSPATYMLDGVRAALLDGVGLDRLLGDVWPLVVMGTVFIPIGLWAFGRAERYAKRTGKLKRVG